MDKMKNFLRVLVEYSERDEVSYSGDVVLNLMNEGIFESYEDILNSDYVDETDILAEDIDGTVSEVKLVEENYGKGLAVFLEGSEYRFVSDKYSPKELKESFENILETSTKYALRWLRENAVNYWSSKEGSETKDIELSKELQEKVKDWAEKSAEYESLDMTTILDKGLVITVFEDEEGEKHLNNELVSEITEYLNENFDLDLPEKWKFDSDEEPAWLASFLLEGSIEDSDKDSKNTKNEAKEDDDTGDDFAEEVEDTEEFKQKMNGKMTEVADSFDTDDMDFSYLDFEVTGDMYVDVVFEVKLVADNITADNIEEHLEEQDFTSKVIDGVSEVVDDYDDTFLDFAELDIDATDAKAEVLAEFKVVNDTGEEGEQDVEENNALSEQQMMKKAGFIPQERDKIGSIEYSDFEKLDTELVKNLTKKDIISDTKVYTRVDVYPHEMGKVVFGFVSKGTEDETSDFAMVNTRVLDGDLKDYFREQGWVGESRKVTEADEMREADLIGSMPIRDFLNSGGRDMIEKLKNEGYLKRSRNDYTLVEIYETSDFGRLGFKFYYNDKDAETVYITEEFISDKLFKEIQRMDRKGFVDEGNEGRWVKCPNCGHKFTPDYKKSYDKED